MNGKQAGDPIKLGKALIEITNMEKPPLHLLMGTDAYQIIKEKFKTEEYEFKIWKELTCSTDINVTKE
ncbi:hypothetical protein [uncultured Bacteroides sp.]|uniref:hypothetical protein n=1 Tax=uncultured Bacteroides sp. TaxID=162156 RepID=UPI002AA8DECB|nr:hypothetical protein [uncultured Bacteroides sp.]